MAKIVIECKTNGETKIEGFGFEGTACNSAMKIFEDKLGKRVARHDKPEIHKQMRVSTNFEG